MRLYVDNRPIGQAVANPAGQWSFPPATSWVRERTACAWIRLAPNGTVIFRLDCPLTREQLASAELPAGHIAIEPGQNLWTIARQAYGQGIRYTVIYQANRREIRDPDLIYPGQVFALPSPQRTRNARLVEHVEIRRKLKQKPGEFDQQIGRGDRQGHLRVRFELHAMVGQQRIPARAGQSTRQQVQQLEAVRPQARVARIGGAGDPSQRCLQHKLAALRGGLLEFGADHAASPAEEKSRQGARVRGDSRPIASTANGPSMNGASNGIKAVLQDCAAPNLAAT